AGDLAKGATLYVTLEPCCHTGQTPPCTSSIIKAGITQVVIATLDPDERMQGKGRAILEAAGLNVITGIGEQAARMLNLGYFKTRTDARPMVTLKLATSLDGKIATYSGHSQWITTSAARQYTHKLRAEHDAILTGTGTILADDPLLTCRLPGLEEFSPIRIILDSHLRTPLNAKCLLGEPATWIITTHHASSHHYHNLQQAGITIMATSPTPHQHVNLQEALALLAENGITRLLVEAGSKVATSFLKENYVDHLIVMRAPFFIGGNGLNMIEDLNINRLSEARRWQKIAHHHIDCDIIEEFIAKQSS
ncbi:MAG: bifunctional diaminohydroxyphosphoribosylaminopyrimidine deaminase/5-amino-6-(5-phosphoribosylamino)uracil reductase RibD, partial [Burkholderiales bacterium]